MLSKKRIYELAKDFEIPSKVLLLVPQRFDRVLSPPIEYCTTYFDQFKARICFPLFPLMSDLLNFYKIALLKLVSNAIRIIVAFELHCRECGILSTVDLFGAFLQSNAPQLTDGFKFVPGGIFGLECPPKIVTGKRSFSTFAFLSCLTCHTLGDTARFMIELDR